MNPTKRTPPGLALLLLNWCLPETVKDDIAGDLSEEFYHSDRVLIVKQLMFWGQTLTTSWRYIMNRQTSLSMCLLLISICVFGIMITAVTFLSNGDALAFNKEYWTSGELYLFFIDPIFWRSINAELFSGITLNLFINYPSIIWSAAALTLVTWIDSRYKLTLKHYVLLALVLMMLPYLWGTLYFKLVEVALKESGPIIAFMWIPIIFLILPLSAGVLKKLAQGSKVSVNRPEP